MPDVPSTRRDLGRARVALLIGVVLALGVGAAAVAADRLGRIDEPADARATAQRQIVPSSRGDVAVVFNVGALRSDVRAAVTAAAADTGAAWAPSRSASVGLLAVRRDSGYVQQASVGFRYPLSVTAMPSAAITAALGPEVSASLSADRVVMGERTAELRGARVGDVVELLAADGSVVGFTIAMLGSDSQVGGAELIMSPEAADRIGVTDETRAVIWGFSSRTAIDVALARHGVGGSLAETRANRSWDPPNPDSTLSAARAKELLGEFSFRVDSGEYITQDSAWTSTYLPASRELLNGEIPIRARCHVRIVDDLRAALADVAAAGLHGAIDVANSNTYGGCHAPRFNRISGQLGFVSRHAWAMALDINTTTNAQGARPQMDCRVVQIFRRHGFAWGGNFLRPDGMHFEWVGERRDQLPYPSRFCPNAVSAAGEVPQVEHDTRGHLFVEETPA